MCIRFGSIINGTHRAWLPGNLMRLTRRPCLSRLWQSRACWVDFPARSSPSITIKIPRERGDMFTMLSVLWERWETCQLLEPEVVKDEAETSAPGSGWRELGSASQWRALFIFCLPRENKRIGLLQFTRLSFSQFAWKLFGQVLNFLFFRLSFVQYSMLSALSVFYYIALELLSLTTTTLQRMTFIACSDILIGYYNIRIAHLNGSDYGTCSAKSSHPISLLVPSYILMGWRVKERPRVRGGWSHRVFECWRWVMVDGTIAQG